MIKPFHVKIFQIFSFYSAASSINIMEMYLKYDKRQQIQTYGEIQGKKMRLYWPLRLIGVKAHSHHNYCQLFTKIYGPKEEGFKEGMN